ncbi:hypothetical protein IGI04_030948 [Brassica rapa subsp. trilocularis]|uniref:ABC transmembrane type-1 domain-containing protein n=1 Tax=Brassica rapa subsp. trilocularis TaxID=1813537 RepID=A0ABQ7LS70_BRACM|nr:hypothetical protein IGI04_030948 [Brassica rapa subsp. trilocularis]
MLMRTPPSIIGLLKSWPGSAFSLISRLGGVGCLTITKWGLLIGLLCLKSLLYLYQIKRCGEMARKICFFKDQISKVGVSPKEFIDKYVYMCLDDVEVKLGELEAELSVIKVIVKTLQWLSTVASLVSYIWQLFQRSIVIVSNIVIYMKDSVTKAFMKAILESFTRVLQGLAFNIVA